jgi:hypothetical protein
VQELVDTHVQLERHKQLLGGILAIVKVGDYNANDDLARVIRSDVGLSQLAAHVRNECRSNVAIQQAFDRINFNLDGPLELPSPTQILGDIPTQGSAMLSTSSTSHKSESNSDTNTNLHSGDRTPDPRLNPR